MDNDIIDTRDSSELDLAINNMQELVTRNYLSTLSECDVIGVSDELMNKNIGDLTCLYKINKLVFQKDENIFDKLSSIYNTSFNCLATVAMIIKSDGKVTDYYLGIVNKQGGEPETAGNALKGALKGNFPGSEIVDLPKEEITGLTASFVEGTNVVSSISGIPSRRNLDKFDIKTNVQGFENVIDALAGQAYTAVILADAIPTSELEQIELGYENLYTQLSPFSKSTHTFNQSESIGLTKTETQTIADSINESVSLTNTDSTVSGWNTSKNRSTNRTESRRKVISPFKKKNYSNTETDGETEGTSGSKSSAVAYGNVHGHGHSVSDSKGTSEQETEQYGRSLQIVSENKTVLNMMKRIEEHLERIKTCKVFGAFNCATYILSSNTETNSIVASNYNSIIRGDASSLQSSYINTWSNIELEAETGEIKKYLSKLSHPNFARSYDENASMPLTAASIITGDELSVIAGLPKKSINGISIIESAPFGRNFKCIDEGNNRIKLGDIYHMGVSDGTELMLDVESLSMHTFVTGSTGSGKSTTVYSLLDSLIEQYVKDKDGKDTKEKIKFLVIEPAKGEYKNRFGGYDGVNVYGTNESKSELLRINPFSFPRDVHVLEHIDRLIEIFNVCWPMYAAMPAILKDAVERAYIVAGWNLETSENKYEKITETSIFPSFADVLNQINAVMDSSLYSADSKGDYKGALCTRVKSLTNGLYGKIFSNDELSMDKLFEENTIVDLSRVGSSETKSFIMGILILKLQEHRMSTADNSNSPLKHVTVLEEAHNILKRTSTEQSSEGSNLVGKSVEMIANSIAEMRTYGEGFIIADQAPGLMDMSVIRNTNTKIILRLPDMEDRKLVGQAASLNENQINELSKLETFVAAVYQNNWLEPVLCKVETNFDKKIPSYKYEIKTKKTVDIKPVVDFLLLPLEKRDEVDSTVTKDLISAVCEMKISSESKISFIKYTKATSKEEIQKLRGKIIYEIFDADLVFEQEKHNAEEIELWYQGVKEHLEPQLNSFNEEEQEKIIAIMTMEKSQMTGEEADESLLCRLMDFI